MNEITSSLCQTDELFSMWASRRRFPGDYYTGGKTEEEWKAIMKSKRKKAALKRMRRKKWITDSKSGAQIIYKIHQDALIEALKWEIINSEKRASCKTERIIIMFDFPVAATTARNMFRRLLKKFGFNQLQQSVWTSRRDIFKPMRILIDILELSDWVAIFNDHVE